MHTEVSLPGGSEGSRSQIHLTSDQEAAEGSRYLVGMMAPRWMATLIMSDVPSRYGVGALITRHPAREEGGLA